MVLNRNSSLLTGPFPFTESVLPIFQPKLLCFDLALLVFLSRNFSLLTQSFPFIESVLAIFELDLPCFDSVLLVFFNWTLSVLNHPIPFIMSVLAIFFTAFFPLLPALRSDLIAMCTVDKINDGGVCRKRLLHYLEEKTEIDLPENLIKIVIRDKKKERKTK